MYRMYGLCMLVFCICVCPHTHFGWFLLDSLSSKDKLLTTILTCASLGTNVLATGHCNRFSGWYAHSTVIMPKPGISDSFLFKSRCSFIPHHSATLADELKFRIEEKKKKKALIQLHRKKILMLELERDPEKEIDVWSWVVTGWGNREGWQIIECTTSLTCLGSACFKYCNTLPTQLLI